MTPDLLVTINTWAENGTATLWRAYWQGSLFILYEYGGQKYMRPEGCAPESLSDSRPDERNPLIRAHLAGIGVVVAHLTNAGDFCHV